MPNRPGPNADSITRELRGFTELRHFDLEWDSVRSTFTLRLVLANHGEMIKTLLCRDVQNLELNPTGDGFHQILQLRVIDVRADGLDRIHFTIDELEHETLFLHCADLEFDTK